MSITFACGQCGKSFTVDDGLAGKTGRCKQCGGTMTIPASTPAAVEDVFGLDEPVLPPRAASPPAPAARAGGDPNFAPPSRKKKKGQGTTIMGVLSKVALGFMTLFVISIIASVFLPGMRPGVKSRAALGEIFQKRVTLNENLAQLLGTVNDVDRAKAVSPQAVQNIRAIAANLREIKVAKGLQTDLAALKDQYLAPQQAAGQHVLSQVMRVAQIPGAWDALAVQGAFEELEREEKSIPGIQQAELPEIPTAAPTVAENAPPAGPEVANAPSPPPAQPKSPRGAKGGMPLSRGTLENLLKRRVSLNEELATLMGQVGDEAQAKSSSVKVVRKIRQVTANLRQIKTAKALPADVEALKGQYIPLQDEASQKVHDQVGRLESMPGVWDALGAQKAFEELEAEQQGIPANKPPGEAAGTPPAGPDPR